MKLRFKELRKKNNLTQQELANMLKISKSYYNYFETGERIIPLLRLNNYCNKFNVNFDYVLGISNVAIVQTKKFRLKPEIISERIKEIRKKRNMTQNQLADLLNTSQSTISAYENGKTLILTAFLYELCIKLNISSDYIVGRSNDINIVNENLSK